MKKLTMSLGNCCREIMLVPHLAKYLHQSPAAIYALVHRGMIPYHKKGKRLYFLKSEILAWIKEGKQKSDLEQQAEVYIKNRKITKR